MVNTSNAFKTLDLMGNDRAGPFFSVGFERMLDRLERFDTSKPQSTYPPYNIVKTGDHSYVIEIATAGFTEADVDITLEDQVLTVKCDKPEAEDKKYLHKGIAARAFTRTFTLADTIQVASANLKDGLLTIELLNVIPEDQKPKKIPLGKQLLLEN